MRSFAQFLRESTDEVFYHGTSDAVLDGIASNGLVHHASEKTTPDADNHGDRANSVYLTRNLTAAHDYARQAVEKMGGAPLVLQVSIPFEFGFNIVRDEADSDGVRFRGTIPVEWVAVVGEPS
jgi:hypothetical protein